MLRTWLRSYSDEKTSASRRNTRQSLSVFGLLGGRAAVRLDDKSLNATMFILPLIDNSAYNNLREILKKQEGRTPLRIPKLSPNPVLMLSLNLTEDSWTGVFKNMADDFFEKHTPVSSSIMDDLGPGLHLAIHDPVIALGQRRHYRGI